MSSAVKVVPKVVLHQHPTAAAAMETAPISQQKGEIIRCGLHKKLKTLRKKWFVLRGETPDASACLEYYDSEKKLNAGKAPNRSIPLKTCFNINRSNDTKYKHVIALYTKDDCFCMVLESEEELQVWLKDLLSLQHGEETAAGETPRPTFEHVWQVRVLSRGLGANGIIGNYRLCLTDKTLSLIRKESKESILDLNLPSIRSCGSLKNFFFLEIGRSSTLGAGELWMESEDTNIAQNIHSTVFHAMSTNTPKDDLTPKGRNRSSSATESSKLNSTYRKHVNSGVPKTNFFSQGLINAVVSNRERCDSMPSRARSTSEGNHPITMYPRSNLGSTLINNHRYQIGQTTSRDISHSPPSGSPVSPPSVGCSTDSTGSSYSLTDEVDMDPNIRFGTALTPDEAIVEEDCPDSPCYDCYVPMNQPSSDDGYVDMSPGGRNHHSAISPTASLNSVLSGTPSTDIRFHDYQLDKVVAYFPQQGELENRPTRAYSFGSRPESYRTKNEHIEHPGNVKMARVRAFSMGSNHRKVHNRILSTSHYHNHSGNNAKSSSAPILSARLHSSSHGSIGQMDDLMELDFSHNNLAATTTTTTTNNGYVEMKPGVAPATVTPMDVSPYVDMRSGSSPARNCETFVDLDQYRITPSRSDYIEMELGKKNAVKAGWLWNQSSDYLDMNKRSFPVGGTPEGYIEMNLQKKPAPVENSDYTNMSAKIAAKDEPKPNKMRSQPIAIQNPLFSTMLTRKNSTPPRLMNLPLMSSSTSPTSNTLTSPYSSLPRTRKNSRRDSKDSCSSSSVTTTPSSSSTIFPININSPSSPAAANFKIPITILKTPYTVSNKPNPFQKSPSSTNDDDYLLMDFEAKKKVAAAAEYVNFKPKDDYALMKPGDVISSNLDSLRLNMEQSCFQPIQECATSRPSSTSSDVCSSSSTLVGSRPESVNSDDVLTRKNNFLAWNNTTSPAKICHNNNNGAKSTTLHYASLDLEENRGTQSAACDPSMLYAEIDFVKNEV